MNIKWKNIWIYIYLTQTWFQFPRSSHQESPIESPLEEGLLWLPSEILTQRTSIKGVEIWGEGKAYSENTPGSVHGDYSGSVQGIEFGVLDWLYKR